MQSSPNTIERLEGQIELHRNTKEVVQVGECQSIAECSLVNGYTSSYDGFKTTYEQYLIQTIRDLELMQ